VLSNTYLPTGQCDLNRSNASFADFYKRLNGSANRPQLFNGSNHFFSSAEFCEIARHSVSFQSAIKICRPGIPHPSIGRSLESKRFMMKMLRTLNEESDFKTGSGLPDFSCHNIPKLEKTYTR
jgi:hypothetical protein